MRCGKGLSLFGPILFAVVACGCGIGRPMRRYRPHEPRTPLVFRQFVPDDCHENGLCAAGLPEGKITLDDLNAGTKRSTQLVPLYDDNIIFTDREGTGVSRMMTPRCVEKLKALAISVLNQWPGKKLRVTDGWIEKPRAGFPDDSLHYEGRAVDITLSDRDRSHNGMLARLAVEAGFDWVYYETKAHIHCSVKSESSQSGRTGGCFPSRGKVTVEGGKTKQLSDLQLGERVLSWVEDGSGGRLVYSEVIMFLDRDTEAEKDFVRLRLSGGVELLVTPQHLVMRSRRRLRPPTTDGNATATTDVVVDPEGGVEAVFAARLEPNDELLVVEGNGTRVVRRILLGSQLVSEKGVIAPLTAAGTVVIDQVVASCYAVFESQSVAHFAFSPVRIYASTANLMSTVGRYLSSIWSSDSTTPAGNSTAKSVSTGVHWYPDTLYFLSNHLIPSYLLYPQ